MALEILFNKGSESIEVTPVGEIDIYTSPNFKEKVVEVLKEEKKSLIINCEKLEYLDSTGLGVFMSILKCTKELNVDITLTNLRGTIFKLFDITGLNKIFKIV